MLHQSDKTTLEETVQRAKGILAPMLEVSEPERRFASEVIQRRRRVADRDTPGSRSAGHRRLLRSGLSLPQPLDCFHFPDAIAPDVSLQEHFDGVAHQFCRGLDIDALVEEALGEGVATLFDQKQNSGTDISLSVLRSVVKELSKFNRISELWIMTDGEGFRDDQATRDTLSQADRQRQWRQIASLRFKTNSPVLLRGRKSLRASWPAYKSGPTKDSGNFCRLGVHKSNFSSVCFAAGSRCAHVFGRTVSKELAAIRRLAITSG